ncbi:MAG: indole-3-glycerol phosphate synthase TrpC [Flavobacteriaceae bacterium]|nr:indole-3-glycerol phosphate synthase TrpC [Flavobacteriaceae bacterium]
MTILDKITTYKQQEVSAKKEAFPIEQLENSLLFQRKPVSLAEAIRSAPTGIIAEHKRRSPSKSVINDQIGLPEVIKGYESAGVSGISVLTDTRFFGGSLEDLLLARQLVSIPLLRKDFIIDAYQIYEAKAYGADAILLIAACLSHEELVDFSAKAKQLGLDVLLEVHSLDELKRSMIETVDLIGVNNRNLKTFEVSLETSKVLADHIPEQFVKISESGISDVVAIRELKNYGYKGFLIGENFMKTNNPGESALNFIKSI